MLLREPGEGGEVKAEVPDGRPLQDYQEVFEHVMMQLKAAKFTGKGDSKRVAAMLQLYFHLLQRGVESAAEQALPASFHTAVVAPPDEASETEATLLRSWQPLPPNNTVTNTPAGAGKVRV